MKELSIYEKAKRYDEAIYRAKKMFSEKEVNFLFPELTESEDERIRKVLRERIIRYDPNNEILIKEEGISQRQFLAWLEKQSKITPTEDELEALRMAAYEPTKNWSEKLQSLYEKLAHCEKGEQNPAWSEEDNKKLEQLTGWLYGHVGVLNGGQKKYAEWLSSLKDKTILQPKQEWSEEDEKEVAVLEAYIRSNDWSERHIDRALGIIDELVNKVKSLRPKSRWKPSEEQITWLYRAADDASKDSRMKQILNELLSELKKLREK